MCIANWRTPYFTECRSLSLNTSLNHLQERPLMQSIKGRRLIVYACVICWTTRNKQGQSPLSL